jgi:hypothetical protein
MSATKTTSPDVRFRSTNYNACVQLFRCPIYGCARKGSLSPRSDENL